MSAPSDRSAARSIAKNTVVLSLARIIDRATTLVLTLVLARKLGAGGLGTYSAALAIYGVIAVAGESGATLFLIRELATDKRRTASYVVHLSAMALAVSILLTAGTELVIRHVGYTTEVQDAVGLVLLAILPKTLNTIQEAVFVVHGRTELETFTTLVSSGLYLLISCWLLAHGAGVQAVLVVYVVAEYGVTVVYYVMITRSIARLRLRIEWRLLRRLASEIKSFSGSAALAALFQRPELIILSLISSARDVGYYSAAVRLSEIWLFVPQVFMNNVYPALTRAFGAGEERFQEVQAKAVRYTLAYALPLSAGMVALASPLIGTLFGARFHTSIVELQLLAINVTLFSLMGLLWRAVSARGRQDTVLRVQLAIIVVRLSSGVGAIVPLASLGAAIAGTASTGLHVALLERVVRRAGAPARLIAGAWRFAVAAAAMGVASWLLSQVLPLWAVVPVAAVLYGTAVAALRAFTAEDIELLRSVLPAWTGAIADGLRSGGRGRRRSGVRAA
jgi:O-antigen/teichoic acid export membrane protein